MCDVGLEGGLVPAPMRLGNKDTKLFACHLLARPSWFVFLAQLTSVSSACLANAVVARKNITNALGESYPVGFLVAAWSSSRLSTAMLEILTEARPSRF